MSKKLNLDKNLIIQKYVDEDKSLKQVAKELGCGRTTLSRYMESYSIPRRTLSEALKGKHKGNKNPMFGVHRFGKIAPSYIDGRKKAKHYCIDCSKEIGYTNWRKLKMNNIKLLFIIKRILNILFTNKDKPCPYWNFFNRGCMSGDGHSLGFDNKDYCKYSDTFNCLHYKITEEEE